MASSKYFYCNETNCSLCYDVSSVCLVKISKRMSISRSGGIKSSYGKFQSTWLRSHPAQDDTKHKMAPSTRSHPAQDDTQHKIPPSTRWHPTQDPTKHKMTPSTRWHLAWLARFLCEHKVSVRWVSWLADLIWTRSISAVRRNLYIVKFNKWTRPEFARENGHALNIHCLASWAQTKYFAHFLLCFTLIYL
jgi:hypothetical protein